MSDESADVGDVRRPPSRPWWTLPGALFALFAVVVAVVVLARGFDAGSSLFIEARDPACEVRGSDDGCVYIVTSPSSDPLSIVASVDPEAVASAFDIEADVACEAIDFETPCQLRVSADDAVDAADAAEGVLRSQLVVTVAGSDMTASIDLR